MTTDVLDPEAIRRDFPIFDEPLPNGKRLVYLDSGATAQKPHVVIEAISRFYATANANIHRGVHQLGELATERFESARENVRRFLNAADPAEVVFTSGTTMSINLVAHGWGRKFLQPGDEILLNLSEHHSNFVPWQETAKATGASLSFLPLTSDGRLDFEALDTVLTGRTKLVAVSGMSNVLGTIHPVAELARRAHDQNAVILVDAAQSVPHLPTDVQASQIDFLAFSGHKLFGPTGVGVLYGRRELLEAMNPFHCGGNMIEQVFREHSTWGALPAKFEAGTLPIAEAIGLSAAIDYVQNIGFEAIASHERDLLRNALTRLAEIPGLRVFGPAEEHRGGIVSFHVEGASALDVASLVDRAGVAVRAGHHCTMPLHEHLGVAATTRASFSLYNTLSDVDALIDALQAARKRLRLA